MRRRSVVAPIGSTGVRTVTREYMRLTDVDPLNDAKTVGIVHEFEPAETTVTFHDVGYPVTRHFKKHAVADEDSRIFIASNDGELETDFGPVFDAPICTNFELQLARTALDAIQDADVTYGPRYVDFDVLFDDTGPVVFRHRETKRKAAVCPVTFEWDQPVGGGTVRPESAPSGPCGPTVGGIDDE
jgi:hypothetical protein